MLVLQAGSQLVDRRRPQVTPAIHHRLEPRGADANYYLNELAKLDSETDRLRDELKTLKGACPGSVGSATALCRRAPRSNSRETRRRRKTPSSARRLTSHARGLRGKKWRREAFTVHRRASLASSRRRGGLTRKAGNGWFIACLAAIPDIEASPHPASRQGDTPRAAL